MSSDDEDFHDAPSSPSEIVPTAPHNAEPAVHTATPKDSEPAAHTATPKNVRAITKAPKALSRLMPHNAPGASETASAGRLRPRRTQD